MRPANIFNVKQGTMLARPVYNSEAGILLDKKTSLNAKYIERIKSIGVRTIFIEDEISDGISISDIIPEERRIECIKYIRKLILYIEAVKDIKTLKIEISEFIYAVEKIIDILYSNKNKIFIPNIDVKNAENDTSAHSVNTGLIGLVIRLNMNYSKKQLIELCVGGMLHDVGKSKIPAVILNKPGRLTDEEYNVIKTHSQIGYDILKRFVGLNEQIKNICLEHHEKVNGLGYPSGLTGKNIAENSKIIALADVYDALTSDRVYKNRMTPDMAAKIIRGAVDTHFDRKIIEVFLKYAPLYPPGSIAVLNTGEIGVILKYKNENEVKIRIFTDEKKNYLNNYKTINLNSESTLKILKILDDAPAKK